MDFQQWLKDNYLSKPPYNLDRKEKTKEEIAWEERAKREEEKGMKEAEDNLAKTIEEFEKDKSEEQKKDENEE